MNRAVPSPVAGMFSLRIVSQPYICLYPYLRQNTELHCDTLPITLLLHRRLPFVQLPGNVDDHRVVGQPALIPRLVRGRILVSKPDARLTEPDCLLGPVFVRYSKLFLSANPALVAGEGVWGDVVEDDILRGV